MTDIFSWLQLIASNVWLFGGTFILVLSLLVFVHEWGHYIVARLCGVRVEVFSIGFGKEICGYTDSHGTRWKLSLIPLGGYVKMFGDTDPASAGHKDKVEEGGITRPLTPEERNVAFFAKPVGQRSAIVFAGPAINFLFAIMLLSGLFAVYGQPVTPPMASSVIVGSAADVAGFKPHDKILSVNGKDIVKFEQVRREVAIALDTPMTFVVLRGGEEITLNATPKKEIITDRFGFEHSKGLLGIMGPGSGFALEGIKAVNGQKTQNADQARRLIVARLGRDMTIDLAKSDGTFDRLNIKPMAEANAGMKSPADELYGTLIVAEKQGDDVVKWGLFGSIKAALRETYDVTTSTLTAMGQIVTGTRSATELGGIIRIGAIAGDMATLGVAALISFTALLSINLGLINLFPIPMLDGGHLVFYGIEAVRGKPLSEMMQEYAFRFGLVVLVVIMVFANLNDILQLVL
ncbi:MAG: RIP metalloprotease RseP [Alphaproteobacteria bacterium]|nr:RIP metalloprotease RseP [Alphaproteobacteria bacterium]